MGRCVCPLSAWQTESGAIVFAERGNIRRSLTLPCGQCIECRLERSRQWGVRIMHEASLHDANSFVTLTYNDENLPHDGGLVYRHFQLFMHRLRKRVPSKIRFFMCGEYGENFGRPHFHACVFGFSFPDRELFKGGQFPLYTSKLLSESWTDGFASVGELSFESACYVARYCLKKVTGNMADTHYWKTSPETGECYRVSPEFAHMSLKPGIGAEWMRKFRTDVYPEDHVVINGVPSRPPRYYDKVLSVLDPDTSEFMELVRYNKSFKNADDSSPDRLRAREIVTRARLKFKARGLR